MREDAGPFRATWRELGANSKTVGLRRIEIDPGFQPTPPHVHGAEEEIVYVLDGSGLSWQNGQTFEIGPGDCLVHRAGREAHTLKAGPDGLDVLIYGQRVSGEAGFLPRAHVAWLGPTWVDAGTGDEPWAREIAAGPLEIPEPVARPSSIVNLEDAPSEYDGQLRQLGEAAGSTRTGLNWVSLPPGEAGAPPHCHSAEEEIFVVLAGGGTLLLYPRAGRRESRRSTSSARATL